MYTRRAITSQERDFAEAELVGQPARPAWFESAGFAAVLATVLFGLVLLADRFIMGRMWPDKPLNAVWFALLVSFIAFLLAFWHDLNIERRDAAEANACREEVAGELADGYVQEGRFEAAEAVEIASPRGRGPRYALRLRNGAVMVLRFDDLPAGADPPAPRTHFTLVRLPASKLIVSYAAEGEPLGPAGRLPARADSGDGLPTGEPAYVDWDAFRQGRLRL